MKTNLLLLAISTLLPMYSWSQFGPGGVGNTSNNGLWLDASSISATNGDPIGTWTDYSGNNNDAIQGTVSRQPLYIQNSALNNQPALRWDGNDDQMLVADADILDDSPGITYFAVIRPNNLNSSPRGILGKRITYTTSVEYAYTFFFYNSDRLTLDIHTQNNRFGTPSGYNNGVNSIYGFSFDGTLTASQRSKIYIDGALITTGNENSTALPNSNQPLCLGALNADYGTYLGADYAEVVQYNYALNTAERNIVDNYLSSKYNISIPNDFYDFDGSHFHQVCGIGREDASNIHNDSRGNAIVRINNPSSLNNGDYLMWGHNNASLSDSNTVDVDGAFIQSRMERVWRADETGDVGTVTITFDMADFTPLIGSDLRLLIDRDGDGFADNDTPPLAGTFAGNTITFTGVDLQYGDYFTVGSIQGTTTPLPLTLINFTGKPKAGKVELLWEVENEIDLDHYTIHKSTNGKKWSQINTTQANHSQNYSTIDNNPSQGVNYYRLSEVNQNGNTNNVKTISVEWYQENNSKIYPNPAKSEVTIESKQQINFVEIYKNPGQLVQRIYSENKDKIIRLNVSELSKGIYIIHIYNSNTVYSKKFTKL